MNDIKEIMLDLKTHLYGKFGSHINLEAEEEWYYFFIFLHTFLYHQVHENAVNNMWSNSVLGKCTLHISQN